MGMDGNRGWKFNVPQVSASSRDHSRSYRGLWGTDDAMLEKNSWLT